MVSIYQYRGSVKKGDTSRNKENLYDRVLNDVRALSYRPRRPSHINLPSNNSTMRVRFEAVNNNFFNMHDDRIISSCGS